MKISEKYNMILKHGYFVVMEIETNSKTGKQLVKQSKTFHKLLGACEYLKSVGEDGNKVMQVADFILKEHSLKVYNQFIKEKA